MIRFACSTCGRRLVSKETKAGRTTKCPACGGALTVPSQWYLLINGKDVGPYSSEELRAKAEAGEFERESYVRETGKSYWVVADRLAVLTGALYPGLVAPRLVPILGAAAESLAAGPSPAGASVLRSMGSQPSSRRRKSADRLAFLATAAIVGIIGLSLAVAILSCQPGRAPDIIAQASSPIRTVVVTPTLDRPRPMHAADQAHNDRPHQSPGIDSGFVADPPAGPPDFSHRQNDHIEVSSPPTIPEDSSESEEADQRPVRKAESARASSAGPSAPNLAKSAPSQAPTFRPPSWLPTRQVGVTMSFSIHYDNPAPDRVEVSLNLPQTLPGKQVIREMTFSPQPAEFEERDGVRWAKFVLAHPANGTVIDVRLQVILYENDLTTTTMLSSRQRQLAIPDREQWLKDEPLIETNHPLIQQAAKTIVAKNELLLVTSVLNGMAVTMNYEIQPGELGAVGVLKAGHGKCADFSNLFVALCRAKKMPARTYNGIVTVPVTKGATPFHRWAEVYLKSYGWVPVDPTWAIGGHHPWEKMEPVRIYWDSKFQWRTIQSDLIHVEPSVRIASDVWVKPNPAGK